MTRKGLVRSWCNECECESAKDRYKRNPASTKDSVKRRSKPIREYLNRIKASTPCADCNKYFHPCQIDFDHVVGRKLFNLSQAFKLGKNMEQIDAEIAKTEIVCSNCHRLRTYQRQHNLKNAC